MKNQIPKLFAMALLITALLLVPAGAQSYHSFKVNIPFSFTVGKTTFSSGRYLVQRPFQFQTGGVMISSENSKESLIRLTRTVQTNNPKDETTLIFHRYGDQYFLYQIWVSGSDFGQELPKSHAERELTATYERQKSAPEIVSIVVPRQQ